jgi:hypothetical protein
LSNAFEKVAVQTETSLPAASLHVTLEHAYLIVNGEPNAVPPQSYV